MRSAKELEARGGLAVHWQGGAHMAVHEAPHMQGGAHKRWFVAIPGVLVILGGAMAAPYVELREPKQRLVWR